MTTQSRLLQYATLKQLFENVRKMDTAKCYDCSNLIY